MPLCSPYPGPLSVLVMDNATIHHGDEILELADRFGASSGPQSLVFDIDSLSGVRIEYLPPYSPDLNPIEEAFSKIKAFIRRNNDLFQAYEDDGILYDMHEVMDIITAYDASGYFIHAGYF
jgi:transposase